MGLSRTPRNKLNMKSLLLVTLLSALVSLSTASITLGKCPVTGANNPDFNPELYLGDWYTAVTNFFPEQAGREISCQRAQYGLLPDGSVSVYNVQTDPPAPSTRSAAAQPSPRHPASSVSILPPVHRR